MTRFGRMGARLVLLAALAGSACRPVGDGANLTELQRLRSGSVDVVLLSPDSALRHGKDTFTLEFRSASGGTLVDVGTVRISASMSMAGTPMFGDMAIEPTKVPGRYVVNSDLEMAGSWRLTVEWDGPAGRGSANLASTVN